MKINSVANGKVKKMEDVNDEAFAQKLMGEGVAVVPSDGLVLAPADGEVTMVFPTSHAVGIKTNEGVEILIHIGIDTVEMNGSAFDAFVAQGDKVKKGDLLVAVELEKVLQAGYEPDIMVIITNTSEYESIIANPGATVSTSDWLLEIR